MEMFFKDLPMEEDPIFQAFLQESHGNPTLLLDWQSSQQSQLKTSKPKKSHHWHLIALIVLLALLLVAFMYQKQIQFYFIEQVDSAEPLRTVLPVEQALKLEKEEIQSTKILKQKDVIAVKSSLQSTLAKDKLPREALLEAPKDSTSDTVFAVLTALESSLPTKGTQPTSPQSSSQSVIQEEVDVVTEAKISANNNLNQQTVEVPEVTKLPIKSELIEQSAETTNQELDLSPTEWLLTQQDSVWAIQLLAVKDKSIANSFVLANEFKDCLLYTSPSPRDRQKSRMPSSA